VVAFAGGAALWLAFGAGRFLGTARSITVHSRFQTWWLGIVANLARALVGLRFEIDHRDPLHPGPLVVIGRHASYGDAILPALLFGTWDQFELRYVLMRELTWEPALDLFGHRLPNHFVDRAAATAAGAAAELGALSALATGLRADEVAVIFPEGQFFTPTRRERALASVTRRNPARAERLGTLANLLPPRPGGFFALLDAAPEADVVVVGHIGFEDTTDLRSILRNAPLRRPVRVVSWRVARAEIPSDHGDRLGWLDQTWAELDRWIDEAR
jgi:1-acyl-sn-glycerol-3-phosphate acyltransferase